MDTSFWVLGLVVVLGGFIALFADRLGKNLGKKRLRLGNLRPRRTAELIVFGAGMLTPLLAILVIMAVSAEAREWIIGGRQAVKQAKQAIESRNIAIKKYQLTLGEVRKLESRLNELDRTVKSARSETEKSIAAARQSQERAKGAESKVRSLDVKVVKLGQTLGERQKALSNVQNALRVSGEHLRQLNTSFTVANKRKDEAEKKVEELNKTIDKLEKDIDQGKGNLEATKKELTDKQKELALAIDAKNQAVEDLNRDLTALNEQLANARTQIDQAQSTLNQLAQNWLYESITYPINSEVARLPVNRQLSASEAERALDLLLRNASLEAAGKGAKAGQSGREADVFDQRSSSGAPVTGAEMKAALVRRMTGQSGEILLVARAQVNSFRGQPVPVNIAVLANPVVFKEGEVLGDTKIDGTIGVGKIFDRIGELLRLQVRQKAEDAQMVPVNGREDAYGKIEPEEIFNAIQTIQNLGRNVRVQVLAKNETRAGGPLELEFRLK